MSDNFLDKLLHTHAQRHGLLVGSHILGVSAILFVIATLNSGEWGDLDMACIAIIISMQVVAHIIASRIQNNLFHYIPAQHDEQH
jgi:hypothetical protein